MYSRTTLRSATHAFVRPPHFRSVPSTGPNGVVINRDMLMGQFRDFYKTLQQSTLIDKLHVMSERPAFESVKVADQMVSIGASCIGMPYAGNEQRISEFMETARYVRGAGGPTTVSSYLQDAENCRCHSGDIVQLPGGIAIGHGPRTNQAAHQVLQSVFQVNESHSSFDVFTLEQEGDAPPLGDYFGFAGTNTLITWKDEHGMLAVDQFQQLRPNHGLQIVYLEPGCHFLSFFGVDASNDVLVQRGYDRSIDSLAAAGLNPIPTQWSEMDKMGVSMRSAVLMLNFLKASPVGMLSRGKVRGARWQAHQLPKGN